MMDYGSFDAITPEQLGRVHWTIENELEQYKNCYYILNNYSITSFEVIENTAIIAETVSVPSTSTINIDNDKAIYISTEKFFINGQLDIEQSSVFYLYTTPDCH